MNDYAAERAALLDAADTINRRYVPRDERILAEVAQTVAMRGITNQADRLAYQCGLLTASIRLLCSQVNALETERANCYSAELLAALQEAVDFIEDQADIRDGADGHPLPNRAMTLAYELKCVIEKAQELQQ